jgi:hypothetical protein
MHGALMHISGRQMSGSVVMHIGCICRRRERWPCPVPALVMQVMCIAQEGCADRPGICITHRP